MNVTETHYIELFGAIIINSGKLNVARCACVNCNSCTCACSCRYTKYFFESNWYKI